MLRKILYIYILLVSLIKASEYEEYNKEIKKNIEQIGSIDLSDKRKGNIVDDLYYKMEDTKVSINNKFNEILVPDFFKKNMKIDLKIADNLEKISLDYIYNPELYKNNKIILTFDKELKIKYIYRKEIESLSSLESPIIRILKSIVGYIIK